MKVKSESEVAQSCPTLSEPMDCSLPGSSAHVIFQARVLEWVAIPGYDLYVKSKKKKKIVQVNIYTKQKETNKHSKQLSYQRGDGIRCMVLTEMNNFRNLLV